MSALLLHELGAVEATDPRFVSTVAATERELPRAELLARGQQVYAANCAACHQLGGEGTAGAFPPLARSDYLMADKDRAIGVVLHGLSGEVTVNGQKFNGVMPSLGLSDTDIAAVLSYVRTNFGNRASDLVSLRDVSRVRAAGIGGH